MFGSTLERLRLHPAHRENASAPHAIRTAGFCFATMGSGVRSSPGPPTNPFSIKHIAVFVSGSNYPSKTTLPFFCPLAATRGFAQVRLRDLQPIGIIPNKIKYPVLGRRIMFPSQGNDSQENQSVGTTDSVVTREILQPLYIPRSLSNPLSDEEGEKSGEE